MLKTQIVDGLEIFSCAPAEPTTKPPLLFVHGAFAGGWMWTETFMPYFAEAGHACYAFSLRGHGGSDGRDHIDWHSINDYVDDLQAMVARMPEPPILVGHSMGGFIVQKYLERHPARAVALLCSVPPQGLIAAQFHLWLQKPQLFLEINRIMGGEYTDVSTLREALFAGEADEDMLAAWLTRMQAESHRAIWDMSMFNLPLPFAMHRPPMLVVGAENDVLVPAFLVQSTARTYGVPAHILRDVGHAITHERDWRDAAVLLLRWLEKL
jgi:non-heme chloroperoxidase